MPMLWITSDGIHSKIARVSPSIGPRAAYMNAAKNTARSTAITVARTGRVYIVRASRVLS